MLIAFYCTIEKLHIKKWIEASKEIPGHFQDNGQKCRKFQDIPGHSRTNGQIPGFPGLPGRVATM